MPVLPTNHGSEEHNLLYPDMMKALGAELGPGLEPRVLYANNERNVVAAYLNRLAPCKEARPDLLDDTERAELRKLATAMTTGPRATLTRTNILEMVSTICGMDLTSGKWSEKRFLEGIEDLYKMYMPGVQHKGSIKVEPMKDGKAPRLIIADGDPGQIMALFTIAILERLVFDKAKGMHIKGTDKRSAMMAVTKGNRQEARRQDILPCGARSDRLRRTPEGFAKV